MINHGLPIYIILKLEAVTQRCSVKKVFLETLQNSQENTCVIFLLKMKHWRRCFPVNFLKFLKTPFLTEHLWWLLLSNLGEIIIPLLNEFFFSFKKLTLKSRFFLLFQKKNT